VQGEAHVFDDVSERNHFDIGAYFVGQNGRDEPRTALPMSNRR
jgi:hypothetical protein